VKTVLGHWRCKPPRARAEEKVRVDGVESLQHRGHAVICRSAGGDRGSHPRAVLDVSVVGVGTVCGVPHSGRVRRSSTGRVQRLGSQPHPAPPLCRGAGRGELHNNPQLKFAPSGHLKFTQSAHGMVMRAVVRVHSAAQAFLFCMSYESYESVFSVAMQGGCIVLHLRSVAWAGTRDCVSCCPVIHHATTTQQQLYSCILHASNNCMIEPCIISSSLLSV
jgi:hypothetical protein